MGVLVHANGPTKHLEALSTASRSKSLPTRKLWLYGEIVGRGHNRRVQNGSAILHAEMDCLENCGRLTAADYQRATIYTTLSPCDMCSGAILLYGIPKVVIGENRTFQGPEAYLQSRGVELVQLDNDECYRLMQDFIRDHPALWNEDIGV